MARASVHTAGWTWSAVAAGVIASLVVQVILVMIGFGVGLVSVDANSATATAGWLVYAWWVMSGIFAAAVGGYVAGLLSPTSDEGLKAVGGLVAWAIATLIVVGASGFSAGSSATAVSALGGPAVTARTVLATQQAPAPSPARRETVGIGRSATMTAEEAREHVAIAMLVGAFALMIGGAAAYFGGRFAPDRKVLEEN